MGTVREWLSQRTQHGVIQAKWPTLKQGIECRKFIPACYNIPIVQCYKNQTAIIHGR